LRHSRQAKSNKNNLLEQCLQAGKTHQVTTVSLHRHVQQQSTNCTDEFPVDFPAICICDWYTRHDGKKNCTTKKEKYDFL
jgi:hypothetical protein